MIYLDHAATSPLRPQVLRVLHKTEGLFGNPSSIHQEGQASRRLIDESRESLKQLLGAFSIKELIFTSGGTESCNLAILGAAFARQNHGKHILISAIEHPAVRESAEFLRDQFGFELELIPVTPEGFVELETVEKMLRPDTILVSVMLANNEIGTLQPVKKIAKLCREKNVLFHTDACQGPGFTDIQVDHLEPDLLSLNASKLGGPKGVGLLYVRHGVKIVPMQRGGGQEFRMRGGTENPSLIAGLAAALQETLSGSKKEAKRLGLLRDKLLNTLLKVPGVAVNGSLEKRLENNINIHVPGVLGETLVMRLDMEGVAVSSGAACSAGKVEASPVLLALGQSPQAARESLRITLGWSTKPADIQKAARILKNVLTELSQKSAS